MLNKSKGVRGGGGVGVIIHIGIILVTINKDVNIYTLLTGSCKCIFNILLTYIDLLPQTQISSYN